MEDVNRETAVLSTPGFSREYVGQPPRREPQPPAEDPGRPSRIDLRYGSGSATRFKQHQTCTLAGNPASPTTAFGCMPTCPMREEPHDFGFSPASRNLMGYLRHTRPHTTNPPSLFFFAPGFLSCGAKSRPVRGRTCCYGLTRRTTTHQEASWAARLDFPGNFDIPPDHKSCIQPVNIKPLIHVDR